MTHTKKRRLQRLRRQEQKEKEAEKLRDEQFEKYRPRIPQGKVQVKSADQSTGPVRPLQPTGLTGVTDRSDRFVQPVRSVQSEPEQKAKEIVPTSAPGASEVPAPSAAEDEELVDYEASPECTNIKINVVRFSDDY